MMITLMHHAASRLVPEEAASSVFITYFSDFNSQHALTPDTRLCSQLGTVAVKIKFQLSSIQLCLGRGIVLLPLLMEVG